jgi:hypothetical protein
MNNGNTSSTGSTHLWKFVRIGGVLQIVFRSGADIVHLDQLDQKLWVALASPTKGIEFDERTLELIDLDKDGRIRAPEVIEASRWLRDVLKNPDDLLKGMDSISLAAINEKTPAGAALLASLQRVIARSSKPEETQISLSELSALASKFTKAAFNGDGVFPAESATEEDVKKVIGEMIATVGGVPDRSGSLGISRDKVDLFFAEVEAFLAWHKKPESDPEILPLAAGTGSATAALATLRPKINDYFARTQLASFDPRATNILNRAESDFLALAAKDLRSDAAEIAQLPLARVEPGRPLPLHDGINPAWQESVTKFAKETVAPILAGQRNALSREEWAILQSKLAAYEQWLGAKPKTGVETLGASRLAEIIQSGLRAKLNDLIQKDLSESPTGDDLRIVEKLLRLQRDFLKFLNNFVSFSDFYSRKGAVFQAGTLYLDARSCELCVNVPDPAKHAALAGLSKAFLAYCDCTRVGGRKMTIAAAFTAGDSDNLMVGRNGVFYDRQGLDWDATITRIIDNPISIRQAFWSPYKKFVRMVEEQVAKRAAAAEAASQAKLTTAASAVATADQTKSPAPAAVPPVKPEAKKIDVGAVAALGVALGSLATFLGLMFTKVIDLGWWAPFAVIAIILAISLPSVLIAWLKLRQRNLGPILDANGWAVNGRMKINVPFGGALSKRAKLPQGAQVSLQDPFHESHAGRYTIIALIFLVIAAGTIWRFGWLDPVLPGALKRTKPAQVLIVPATTNAAPETELVVPPANSPQ